MLCESLTHYASLVLSKMFYFEVRALVGPLTSFNVKDVIDQKYTLIKSSDIFIDSHLAIIMREPVEVSFAENTSFYCVFYNKQYDLVVIPQWCQQIIIGTPSQTFSIQSGENHDRNELKIEGLQSSLQMSKFDIIMEDKNGHNSN